MEIHGLVVEEANWRRQFHRSRNTQGRIAKKMQSMEVRNPWSCLPPLLPQRLPSLSRSNPVVCRTVPSHPTEDALDLSIEEIAGGVIEPMDDHILLEIVHLRLIRERRVLNPESGCTPAAGAPGSFENSKLGIPELSRAASRNH